jgi:hypothetical protein
MVMYESDKCTGYSFHNAGFRHFWCPFILCINVSLTNIYATDSVKCYSVKKKPLGGLGLGLLNRIVGDGSELRPPLLLKNKEPPLPFKKLSY